LKFELLSETKAPLKPDLFPWKVSATFAETRQRAQTLKLGPPAHTDTDIEMEEEEAQGGLVDMAAPGGESKKRSREEEEDAADEKDSQEGGVGFEEKTGMIGLAGKGGVKRETNAKKQRASPNSMLVEVKDYIRSQKSPTGATEAEIFRAFQVSKHHILRKALEMGMKKNELVRVDNSYMIKDESFVQERKPSEQIAVEEVRKGLPRVGSLGLPVEVGDVVEICFKATLVDTGDVFFKTDSFTFIAGENEVIKGLEDAVLGMRVGDRRRVTIPPALAYGSFGNSIFVPPDAIIMIDMTILSKL